jgi:hypothetical protein
MLELREFPVGSDCDECLDAGVLALFEAPREPARLSPPGNGLEIPQRVWTAMAAAYGVFFSGLAIATAHSPAAIFALVVSLGYAAMYFGTARILLRVNPAREDSAGAAGDGWLSTWTGPMSPGAVAGQVLAIPAALALFGTCFAIAAIVVT